MPKGLYQIPYPDNEPVRSYAPDSDELKSLLDTYHLMYNQEPIDMPMYIGSREVRTGDKKPMCPPHEYAKVLGHFNQGDASHVHEAIDAALEAKSAWAAMPWEHRASIFLKAAELLAGPFRDKMNAATMLAQSKNVMQAEIDAACEMIDFFRFNVYLMQEMYGNQPDSQPGIWNRMEYRPLEGFVFAISPFNFTSIAANLPASAAMMGNTCVWKPAETQMYSAQVIMELFKAAGLPDGVINLISVDGPVAGDVVFKHKDFAGLHFTGSTGVFQHLWKEIGNNITSYRSYPRVVGETGGKDFIMVHKSAVPAEVATAISRGAFEFQGQKCSAASRAYIPAGMWPEVKHQIVEDVKSFKMGSPEDPSNFINAVIDKRAYDKITNYIDHAKQAQDAEIIVGGNYGDSEGYFIEPTVIVTTNAKFKTMCEEIFGPVITIYVYDDEHFEETMDILNDTSPYALTGSIFATDRYAIDTACKRLQDSAGNFYINDKPTGAVVNQQPFGGARGSGTNDKAGSMWNLIRWVSPRTIKETFVPPKDYRYPFLG